MKEMLKEVRSITNRSRQIRIYFLLDNGLIPKHISQNGYVAYDPEELIAYEGHQRRGRKPKK